MLGCMSMVLRKCPCICMRMQRAHAQIAGNTEMSIHAGIINKHQCHEVCCSLQRKFGMCCATLADFQVSSLNPPLIANLNSSDICGLLGGQVAGTAAGANATTASYRTSNALVFSIPGGVGFSCYLLTPSSVNGSENLHSCKANI